MSDARVAAEATEGEAMTADREQTRRDAGRCADDPKVSATASAWAHKWLALLAELEQAERQTAWEHEQRGKALASQLEAERERDEAKRESDDLGPFFVRDLCRLFGVDENEPLRMDKLADRLASVPALVEALRRISEWQPSVLETLRANGIVFRTALDKPDDERTDAERWEKVEFSLYTDLCEVDTQARAALTVYEQSQGKP